MVGCPIAASRLSIALTYRLSFERPKDNSSVVDGELGQSATGHDSAFADIIRVHDAENVKLAVAGPLHIIQQTGRQVVFDAWTEEGRMERDHTLHLVKEEHGDDERWARVKSFFWMMRQLWGNGPLWICDD